MSKILDKGNTVVFSRGNAGSYIHNDKTGEKTAIEEGTTASKAAPGKRILSGMADECVTSGTAEEPVRPLDVSEPASVADLCAAAAEEGFTREEREYQDDEEIQCGARRPVKIQDTKLPSAEEAGEHSLTHLPYRAWCPHCGRRKGKSMQHKQLKDDQGIREIHVASWVSRRTTKRSALWWPKTVKPG